MTPGRRALVVACLRHTDLRPEVDPLTGRVRRDARSAGPAPAEQAALELALRIGAAWDATVLAVCAGPPDADRTLRAAAAVGAQVLRVSRRPRAGGDPLDPVDRYLDDLADAGAGTAAALAGAVRTVGEPDLVICGARSADRGTGAFPAFLAAELGAAQALGLVRLELAPLPAAGSSGGAGHSGAEASRADPDAVNLNSRPDLDAVNLDPADLNPDLDAADLDAAEPDGPVPDRTARVAAGLIGERRLDRGRRERLAIPCPAVVSVEPGTVRLRRAGLTAELAAAALEVPVVAADTAPDRVHRGPARAFRARTRVVPPPAGATSRERLLALTGALEERTPPTVLRPADAAEAVDALLDHLHRTGFLPDAPPGR